MKISLPRPMLSAAGWYVGRTYVEDTYPDGYELHLPYDRLSEYMETKEEALESLEAFDDGDGVDCASWPR